MSETKRELKRHLRGFMGREVEDLTVDELQMALRCLRAARADAYEEDNDVLYEAAGKVMVSVRREWQRRVTARYFRDLADGRHR